jgi:mono/diheme cytochrome c family protein
MKTISTLCALGAAALAGCQVSAQEPVERGRQVFAAWCAPCHSTDPGNPGTVALEVRYQGSKPAALEARTDLTPDLTRFFVRNGLSIMPPFRKTEISDADLEALAAYLAPRGD